MKKITLILIFSLLSFVGFSQGLPLEGFENTSSGPDLPTNPSEWTLDTGTLGNQWMVFDNGVGTGQRWDIYNSPAANVYAGVNSASINRENVGQGNTSEDYLATPLITVPTNGRLRFWTRTGTNGPQGNCFYQIKIAPATAVQNNPAEYTLLQQWNETSLTTTFNIYEEKIVDLSAYANQSVYIAFVMVLTQPSTGITGDRWIIDNAQVVQQCNAPTSPTTGTITYNSANFNWQSPGVTTWEIEVVIAGNAPTGVGTLYSGPLPYTATGLLPNTTYQYYVRNVCGTNNTSAWTTSAQFTTLLAPVQCNGNFADSGGVAANYANTANSTVVICPTGGLPGDAVTVTFTSFDIAAGDGMYIYNGNSAAAPLISSGAAAAAAPLTTAGFFSGTTFPGPFTSSSPDGCLTYVFRSNSNTTATGWVANITCAPLPTCPKPFTVSTSLVTSTSVSVAWQEAGTAAAWEVLALPCGSPAPTATATGFTPTTTNPQVISGLNPDTCYDIYVRSVCSSSLSSGWSGPKAVTTLVAPPVCGSVYTDLGGIAGNYPNSVTATTPGGTVTITPTVAGEQVIVTFTAFNTQATSDVLRVYDGSSTAATLIGTYSGDLSATLPVVESTTGNGLTFQFISNATTQSTGWAANVVCQPFPSCQKPTNVAVANITYSTVSVSWTNNATTATQWEVIAVPAGSPAPGAGAVGQIATASPYIYTGLSPVTSYDVYVRAICPGNDVGPWSNIKATLTTPESCPKPTNVVATVQTFSTVSVAWTNNAPGATQWEVIAVPTGSPAPTATSLGQLAAASPYLYTGLNSQTTYDFYVRTICQPASGTDIGLWSITASTTSTLPNYCAGDHFYDLGGATGNYPNNANSTVTICPDSPGQVVTVYFNSFNLVSSLNDTLTIYDGNNTTTGAVIGTYYGTNIIPNYTASGPSGCLTFRFVSNGTLNAAGWDATIICGPPCPSIVANINASTPAAAADNTIKICQGGSIEFVGSGTFGGSGTGATYEWDFGDGSTPVPTATATHTYANEGIYLANLKIVAADGCRSNNKINQLVYVSTTPNFNGITIADDEICLGQSTTILGSVVPKPFFKDCAPPVSGTTFLPDGAGNSYQSQVPVDCFPFGTNLTSASQIASVCINMEHSYLGDLELRLISPTGQSIILHQYPGGGGTYLGCPLDDPAVGPGTGRTYCFTPSATTLLVNGTTSAACANTTPGNSIVAGNYAPVQSFAGLIGSPLNGNWSLLVTDNLNIDNGYIFDWTIDFANSILPTNYQFTPVVANTSWTANPSIVSTNGQTITVTPTTVGQNCYTYNMTDDFGCTYSKQVCLNVTAGVALTDVTSVSPICNGGNSSFTLTGSPDTTVSYSIDGGASQSVALGSTGQAVINLTGLTASTTINTTYITAPVVPTSGNAITAVGGVTPVNATGPISAVGATASAANCTTINNGNSTLTLTFDDEILAGTNVTISIARSNTAGSVNISDGSTAPPTVFNNVVYPGPNAVIQHITFTPTVNTNTIIITRNNGNTFVDGAQYSFNAPGCDAPAIKTSTITVTPVLTDPVITNVSEICAGSDAVFNLTGLPNAILSYTIDGGAAQTITLNNLGTAAITVTAPTTTVSIVFSNLTLNGCTRVITNTASIAVKPVPTLTSFVSNSPLCAGDNAVFTITGTPNSTVNYTIGSGSNQQLALGATGQNTITVNAVTANTTVSLSGIDLNGCALPSTQSLTVLVAPVLYDPTITNVSEMCIGGDAVFNVTGLPNGLISYSINGGASQLLTLSATGTGVITSIAPTSTVNLTMTSISINTCARLLTNTASIIVKPVPSVTSLTTPETIICSGLDAILTVTGTANSNVTYSIGTGASQQLVLGASGQNTISLNDLTANTTVTLSNVSLNGCSQPTTQSLTVTVVALTSATFTLVPEYCLGETVDPLPTTSQNGVAGVWAPALVNTTISGPANYVFTPMATMCAETTTVSLTVNGCDIQKGISPKGIGAGDGLNDNFDLSGFNVSKLEIFNRHGLKVYDKSNYEDEWFGQSNSGQELPDGTYYYVISFSDSETKTGWIYINREK